MNVRCLISAVFATLLPLVCSAQGFAGLGGSADGFAVPQRGAAFSFPRDHGAHPDYRIEWWYLTANLTDADGVEYGLQWTLFRSALAPETQKGWNDPQLWMGHAAVTTPEAHYVSERLARGGIGQAGVRADPFEAWIDDWSLSGNFDALTMTASGSEFSYEMSLSAQGPLVFHGEDGYSVKSEEGQASYYYSQPAYEITGTLRLPDGEIAVTGSAWLDREWSSQPLSDQQSGWDWFSLSFDSGAKLMGFQLRQSDGQAYTSGTWIGANGDVSILGNGDFQAEPTMTSEVGPRVIPTQWSVSVPAFDAQVTVAALNSQAWMATSVPYWEGPVTISGSHSGRGYLEMTGYPPE